MTYSVVHGYQGRTQEEWLVDECDTLREAIESEARYIERTQFESPGYVYVCIDTDDGIEVMDGTWLDLDKGDNGSKASNLRPQFSA